VRGNLWRRIVHDNISADGTKRRIRVKADAIPNEIGTVFKAFDFVNHALIGQLGVQQCHLLFSCLAASPDVMPV
tara:strand:- start:85 stop:306 length:222 start_codon:yes stop_codon:yes gene_type:complete